MNAATRHLSKARSEANLTDAKTGSARRYRRALRRTAAAEIAEQLADLD